MAPGFIVFYTNDIARLCTSHLVYIIVSPHSCPTVGLEPPYRGMDNTPATFSKAIWQVSHIGDIDMQIAFPSPSIHGDYN